MKQSISPYPRLFTDADESGIVARAGEMLLLRYAEKLGLTSGLSTVLESCASR